MRRAALYLPALLLGLLAAVLLAARAEPPEVGEEEPPPTWERLETLIGEQKYAAAREVAAALRRAAETAADDALLTRALLAEARLVTGLHGYEETLRLLRAARWPEEPLQWTVVQLSYAQALVRYLQVYSWEISGREEVLSDQEVPLERWSRERILAEAEDAFEALWAKREEWGATTLALLARHFEAGNFPARIRGTLRDAVTYLWVERLADSSLWTAREANALYRLDLSALIEGAEPPEDAAHPLTRLATVLGDLERWHTAAGREEAAFEARRERLARLHDALPREEDRLRVRGALEGALATLGRSWEWWSVGMASLAQMVQAENDPWAPARAHRLALEGAEAHPRSIGGQRCRHLAASLETPDYRLLAMAGDGPGRRSLEVTHRNLTALSFRAYRLDLEETIAEARDRNLLPSHREVEEILGRRRPDAEWRVELPPTPDFRHHRTFVVPPLERTGLYVVVASEREDFAARGSDRQAVVFVLGDPVLLWRFEDDALEATVRSGETGRPLAGVEVTLYQLDWQGGHRAVETRRTEADGRARFAGREGYHALVARRGEAVALADLVAFSGRSEPSRDLSAVFLYTDRSVYRPGQTVHWKAVAYEGDAREARYRTRPGAALTVELADANGEVVAAEDVETNAFGSASGSFVVPPGRLLGGWALRTSAGGHAALRVEEYVRPTFEVTLGEAPEDARLNRRVRMVGEARYYFGLPLANGSVDWRVTREPVVPPWRFGWWPWPPAAPPEVVAAGAAMVEANGSFEVAFTPEADERLAALPGLSYRFEMAVEVTDEGGETRSTSRQFRIGFVAVEAVLDTGRGFARAGEPLEVAALRTDLDGSPRPGRGSWRLVEVALPAETRLPADLPVAEEAPAAAAEGEKPPYRTPGDRQRPRWAFDYQPEREMASWPDGEEVARGGVEHGADGRGVVLLEALPAGLYRLHYATEDAHGAAFETRAEILVAPRDEGGATALPLPLVLEAERSAVPVGETARFLVSSGLTDQEMLLEVFRAGARVERRTMASNAGPELVEIPLDEAHRGGFSVRLTALRDHQLLTLERAVFVPWDDRRLEVAFETFRDRLRPGESESFRVKVRAAAGEDLDARAAELLAYMYDRSLDLFAPHEPPRPLGLYPDRRGSGSLASSLGPASPVWQETAQRELPPYPHLAPDRLTDLESYGIGGPGGGALYRRDVLVMASASPDALPPPMEAARAAQSGPRPEEREAEEPLRQDFAETAFWEPHLLLAADGSVEVRFEVPDSVTEWSVWFHALTRDLRAGSIEGRTRSVKELLVRPYLPRFLREGDRALLEVAVQNAGEMPLSGWLDLEVVDPSSGESLGAEFGLAAPEARRSFEVEPGGGVTLEFALRAPARLGSVAVRARAEAGDLADGEQRPLPILPGRVHLAQSRFAALDGAARRELRFSDLAEPDPTRLDERLVVTLDAQLFHGVLSALPYLVEYPYECTEQTLNRFLSTAIVATLFDDYPAVARMAEELATRETRWEAWTEPDPNRALELEETPWSVVAAGGDEPPDGLIKVLDPAVARAQRETSLLELARAQTSLGGFPWWPGGPPSPHMTLYILQGLARAREFGVEVPSGIVEGAWRYLHRHYLDEMARRLAEDDCCWETVTFLNFLLSSFPEDSWREGGFEPADRERMLAFSFRHWREHAPLLKGQLALTLARAGRAEDARLVFDSVMDSARTDPDLGTYWAPEERAWLWYNDTLEGHAFALRVLTELDPGDPRRHGLVHWLFLNKQLNHWKSTRATSEVIYALVHYLRREGLLEVREEATVRVGERRERFVFEPDAYTGKEARVVLEGPEIGPEAATVVVEKETPGLLFASATWHFSTERLPEEERGDLFSVSRRFFRRTHDGERWVLHPLEEGALLAPGDQVEVQLTVRARHAAEYVHLRDPRGAGFEPERLVSGHRWDLGIGWYEEVRDSGANFFFDWLPAGAYTLKHRLRAATAGTFRIAPATLQSLYAPEFAAYSRGEVLEVRRGTS